MGLSSPTARLNAYIFGHPARRPSRASVEAPALPIPSGREGLVLQFCCCRYCCCAGPAPTAACWAQFQLPTAGVPQPRRTRRFGRPAAGRPGLLGNSGCLGFKVARPSGGGSRLGDLRSSRTSPSSGAGVRQPAQPHELKGQLPTTWCHPPLGPSAARWPAVTRRSRPTRGLG